MDEQAAAELRLEPGALWRHDLAGIGDGQEFVGTRRVHREGHACGAGPTFEFIAAADTTDKLDPGVGARITNPENGSEHSVLQQRHVKAGDWVVAIDG